MCEFCPAIGNDKCIVCDSTLVATTKGNESMARTIRFSCVESRQSFGIRFKKVRTNNYGPEHQYAIYNYTTRFIHGCTEPMSEQSLIYMTNWTTSYCW